MDVQTGLVYVAVVIISALVVGFVSVFAIKEKSYEEAIAEQRKLPDDLLLGKKEKVKDKKHKNKTGKKVKEKKEEKEEKEEKPEHVQFEETPQILPPEPPAAQENGKGSKKKGKVEKVKPILLNKDEPVIVIAESSASQPPLLQEGNHFDVIQPKDDLELIRSHSRENLSQISQPESTVNKSPKETPTKTKKNNKEKDFKKKDDHKEEKKETPSPAASTNQHQAGKDGSKEQKEKPKELVKETKELVKEPKEAVKETITPVQNANKESKKVKKKNDILAQIGGDRDGINFSLLKPLVQKAELSRSEIQFLIDQLLNKQQDNPLEHAEWTESRADPVIKLKKQLADKEKALKDEQEASQSVQSKLLELRQELNSERSRLRQIEEALAAKVAEAQTLHTRMQHILESHAAEKQGFSRQIEQLQVKINEDQAIILKMQEEQGQSHGQMQQELIAQRKQLETSISQMRENENALKAQLAQKHAEIQELQNHNLTISEQLQATCESSMQEFDELRHQNSLLQDQVLHLTAELQQFQETSEKLQDAHRQLQDSQRVQSEMDHRIKSMHRHEQELQKQIARLESECNAGKAEISSLRAELEKVRSELSQLKSDQSNSSNENNSETSSQTNLQSQLTAKEEELQKKCSQLDASKVDLKKAQSDVEKLKVELKETQNQMKSTKSELVKVLDSYKLAQSDLMKCQEELKKVQEILIQNQSEFSKIKSSTHVTKDSKVVDAELQVIKLKEDVERLSSQLQNMTELQKEIKQLREKNESLLSQITASTQRPAVEGQENGIEEKVQKNSVQLVENALASKDQIAALKTALLQKEKQLDQLGVQVESLRSEINSQRSITLRLQDDLEQQRSKNDDLRRKNWKVMEALNSAENRVKNNTGIKDEVQKIKNEEQKATKALLQRIFPEVKVAETSHEQWMKMFEQQVHSIRQKLKVETKSEDVHSELDNTNKNLQAMVNHYKQIIDDTEGMLNKLQSHIESEEKRWQAQLWQKENEVSNLRVEIHDLQAKTKSSNELQRRITELETRLSEAESIKERTKTESQVSQTKTQNSVRDLGVVEQLQEEKLLLIQQLQNESSKRAVLDEQVAELRSLIQKSESNLAQEKKFISHLQHEMLQIKNEVGVGSSSLDQSTLNGPPTSDSSKSEGGSGKK